MASQSEGQLLTAVSAAFAADLGATLKEIAEAVGVGRTTLHRRFPTRQALTMDVANHGLRECDRIFDAVGIDDRPPHTVLAGLADECLPLAVAYQLIWAEPPITDDPEVRQAGRQQNDRFERFAARAQRDGYLRGDLPPRWMVYSIGSQVTAVWHAVRAGFIGPRDAPRVVLTSVADGLGGPSASS